jgi:hypothetical protein
MKDDERNGWAGGAECPNTSGPQKKKNRILVQNRVGRSILAHRSSSRQYVFLALLEQALAASDINSSAAGTIAVSSEVDPIVASFFRGAVGVITSLMIVELNNVNQ